MLKKLMDQIHDRLGMPNLSRDFGTQMYEQQVVELSQNGERGGPGGGCGDWAARNQPAWAEPLGAELRL